MSHYPPIPQRKSCNCEDPCISTDDVYYAGPNLPYSGINTYNVLTEVIEKLDAIYSFPTLQKVTEAGNYTTLPLIADSFVKIGGNGSNVLLDNGDVLPIGNLPTGVTETSQLINDGEDGINPFITALDIPVLGYTPVNKAGDTMLGDLILNEDPSTALGAATKQYVDNVVTGINFHAPVVVATDVPLVATYDNGVDGVGATLTGPSVGVLSIDGEFPAYLDRILVWKQVDAIENGVYDLTTVGDVTTIYQLTRSSDADNSPPGEIHYGDYTLVLSGDTNGGFGFICNTPGTIDIGITPINYIQFNAAQAVTAGYGLQEAVSNVISIDPAVTQEKIGLTTTGVTQSASNNSTRLATTEYVDRQIGLVEPVSNITIESTSTIYTETQGVSGGNNYSQNGRNVMIQNLTSSISIISSGAASGFIASYTKLSQYGANITFSNSGVTLIAPSGAVLNGTAGSTALLTKNGSTVYVLINNI